MTIYNKDADVIVSTLQTTLTANMFDYKFAQFMEDANGNIHNLVIKNVTVLLNHLREFCIEWEFKTGCLGYLLCSAGILDRENKHLYLRIAKIFGTFTVKEHQ